MRPKIYQWLRIFLGVFIIGYVLNQFLHILPTSYGDMPEIARDFIDATVVFLPALYLFEVIIGLMLIFNIWTRLILIILFPLSVSFVIFSFTNADVSEAWPAFVVAAINIILLVHEKDKYSILLQR